MKEAHSEIIKYDDGLDAEKHNELARKFNPFMVDVTSLIDTAKTVDVQTVADKDAMKTARETRLALRRIRCDVEDTRKTLKEASLREGKAIDGMANIIKFIIVPVEDELQAKEDFAKRVEAKRLADLAATRSELLRDFDVDSQHFDLAAMSDEAFEQLRSSSEAGYKAKINAEKEENERIKLARVEAERVESELRQKEAEERKQLQAENARLSEIARVEAEKRAAIESEQKKAAQEIERIKKEIEEKDRKATAEIARVETEKKQAEINKAKADKENEQARLSAPDKDKIGALVSAICALIIPSVSSETALDAIAETRGMLNSVVKRLRLAQAEISKKKGTI